jgi:protein TonB
VTEGWVELLFTVSETGEVDDIEVVEASSPELEESAVNAVRRWRFEPYLEQGRPIPVRSGIRFTFQS